MKKRYIGIFIIVLISIIVFYFKDSADAEDINLNKEKILSQDDMKFIAEDLFEKFDYLYPSVEYELESNDMKNRIFEYIERLGNDKSDVEFGKFLMKEFARLDDSQVNLSFDRKWLNEYFDEEKCFLPIKIRFEDENCYVLKNIGSEISIDGKKISKIDGLSIDIIVSKLVDYIAGENDIVKYSKLADDFGFYYGLVFGYSANYELEFDSGLKQIVSGISIYDYSNFKDGEYYSMDIESNEIARIKLKGIDQYWRYSIFLEESFKEMKDKDIDILILDLRGSNLDNPVVFYYLSNYLFEKNYAYYSDYQSKHNDIYFYSSQKTIADDGIKIEKRWNNETNTFKRNSFNGEVYVLIDNETRGIAPLFVDFLRYSYRAYIYGKQTGGMASSFGRNYNYNLKRISMNIDIPTERFISCNQIIQSQGVLPDKKINQDIEMLSRGIDYQKLEVLKDTYQKINDAELADGVLEHEIFDWKLSNFDMGYDEYREKLRPYVSREYVFKEYDELFILQGKKYTARDLDLLTDEELLRLQNLSKQINEKIEDISLQISEVYNGHNDKWRYIYTHTEIMYDDDKKSNIYKKYVFIKEWGYWKLIDQSRVEYSSIDYEHKNDGLDKFRSTLEGNPVIYRYKVNLYEKLFGNQ
ncbi:MAG: S41 family peptidase [Tissierellales bacterium]|nr:S41 family peptidase [Tissierellales bacterium]